MSWRLLGMTGAALMLVLAGALSAVPTGWLTTAALAADKAVASKEATDITANSMEVMDEKNLVVFTGNVRAKKGDTVLSANRLEVYTEKGSGNGKDGKGSSGKMRRWVASGNVRIVKGNTVITGNKAVMDVKTDTVTVTGNVVVRQPDSTIRGARLVTNLKTNVTRVLAGSKGRVHGVFR